MGIFILIILACVICLCFLGSRLNKVENNEPNHSDAEKASRNTENDISDIGENKTEYEEQELTNEDMKTEKQTEETKPDTLGLMFNTLCNLGCQPVKNPDDTISVKYQGENFHMEFGGLFARVWDPMWAGVKADDPDLPKIREAVNSANFNFGPTVVLTSPDEEGVIGLHTRRDIMLHPACPDNIPFVKSVLDSFFDAKNEVRSNFQKLNATQAENQKNRRPVGFATDIS